MMKVPRVSAWTIALVLVIATILSIAAASGQKSSGNSSGPKLWFSAMDADNDGTVSKKEFETYMDAQFDKADVDHDGTLDRSEMEQLRKNLAMATR